MYFPAIILLSILPGCVAASETLSGSDLKNGIVLHPSAWNDIQIGVTTKEEVQSLLGNPTKVQVSSKGEMTNESWSYVSDHAAHQPFQYVLFLGALAIPRYSDREPLAVSFSPEGIVNGLTVSPVHAQGHEAYGLNSLDSTTTIHTYGMKNPLAQNFRSAVVRESAN